MNTLLRCFAPNGDFLFARSGVNIPVPNNGDIVFASDVPYYVRQVSYDYDENECGIDISLKEVGEEFWNDIEDGFECDGCCDCCELNDAGMGEDDKDEYNELREAYNNAHAYLDGVKDLFNHLGYDFKFDIEIGKGL